MVKTLDATNADIKINVILKSGERFTACDVPNQPFGESERIVSFWLNDIIHIIPMENIACILMYDANKTKEKP